MEAPAQSRGRHYNDQAAFLSRVTAQSFLPIIWCLIFIKGGNSAEEGAILVDNTAKSLKRRNSDKKENEGERKLMKNYFSPANKNVLEESNQLPGESREHSNPAENSDPQPAESPKKSAMKTEFDDPQTVVLSFKWEGKKFKCFKITGAEPDLLIEGLKRSAHFKKSYTDPSMYLLIQATTLDAVISPYVPLGALPKGESLIIGKRKVSLPQIPKYTWRLDGIIIYIANKGITVGGAGRTILENEKYCPEGMKLAVYYEHWAIKQAILTDGRFKISPDCEFSLKGEVKEEHYENHIPLSSLKNVCKHNLYTIVVPAKRHSEGENPETEQDPNLSFTSDSWQEVPTRVKYSPNDLPPYPLLYEEFSEKFKTFLGRQIATKWNILKENFSKDITEKNITLASTHRLLTQHQDSVGLITFRGSHQIIGTCFLLTRSLVLTCDHVKEALLKLTSVENIIVRFNYETSDSEPIFYSVAKIVESDSSLDYAFLQLFQDTSRTSPGLLKYLDFPPEHNAVSIIGHPGSEFKQIDLCSVISFDERVPEIRSHPFIHLATKHTFQEMRDPHLVTYQTCFYHGSSGSPVFNSHGKLVAMHSGGYIVDGLQKKKSIIEFGRSLIEIIIHGAVQIKDLRDVLWEHVANDEDLMKKFENISRHSLLLQPTVRRLLQLWGEEHGMEPNSDTTESIMEVDQIQPLPQI
ncbi:LOW QUALITY PROTEIN: serine protease FAM111A-like [Pelodytes ibericus]